MTDRRRDGIVALVVAVVAFASYAWVLSLPMTAIDAYPTIVAAKADSVGEALQVPLRELRGGTVSDASRTEVARAYYRPLTLSTYTVDYLLWKWQPFGYHLTDLLLHTLACVLVYVMARSAFGFVRWAAVLATAIFVFHPAALEVVPAVTRRQEPLLVIGFALALVGCRRLPSGGAWLTVTIGALVAVTSVERGLVVPGVVFAYLLCLGECEAFWARVRRSLLYAAPVLAIAVAFYLVRGLIVSGGGIHFSPRNIVRVPLDAVIQLLYSQQPFDLAMPTTATALAAWGSAGTVIASLLAYALWRTREAAIVAFAILWILGYTLLFAVAGISLPWYIYTAVPALGLCVAALAQRAAAAFGEPRGAVRGAIASLALIVLILAVGIPSPVLRDYPAWRAGAEVAGRLESAIEKESRQLEPGATIVVINTPGYYRENSEHYLATRSASIRWPRSLRVWAQARELGRQVVGLGASNLVGAVSAPVVDTSKPGRVGVSFPGSPSTYADPELEDPHGKELAADGGFEFSWPPPGVDAMSAALFVFDGDALNRVAPPAVP